MTVSSALIYILWSCQWPLLNSNRLRPEEIRLWNLFAWRGVVTKPGRSVREGIFIWRPTVNRSDGYFLGMQKLARQSHRFWLRCLWCNALSGQTKSTSVIPSRPSIEKRAAARKGQCPIFWSKGGLGSHRPSSRAEAIWPYQEILIDRSPGLHLIYHCAETDARFGLWYTHIQCLTPRTLLDIEYFPPTIFPLDRPLPFGNKQRELLVWFHIPAMFAACEQLVMGCEQLRASKKASALRGI